MTDHKGIIALDIDGTLTNDQYHVPTRTAERLRVLVHDGWHVILITGRPFSHAARLFNDMQFTYHVAPQNGALLVEMPGERVVKKHCISPDCLDVLAGITGRHRTSFAVFGGWHCKDASYWCPMHFTEEMQDYLKRRQADFGEAWIALEQWSDLPIDDFASVKCIAERALADRIAEEVEEALQLHMPVIDDPFDPLMYVAQGTHPEVSKGSALKDFAERVGNQGPLIAAGDNANDFPLLAAADISIAMKDAPEALRAMAQIIAPPASEEGILRGLEEALERCGHKSV